MIPKMKTDKPFDCVEFKRQSQARLMAEYERRRQEFDSFHAFVNAKAEESDWVRSVWRMFSRTP